MAGGFTQNPDGIVYREDYPASLRLLAGSVGLALLVLPPLFWRAISAGAPASGQAIGWIATAGACLAGLIFLALALRGARRLVFDGGRREVFHTRAGPLGLWHRRLPFAQIERLTLIRHEPEDDAPWYQISLETAGRSAIPFGLFATRDEAERRLRQLQDFIAASPDRG